MRERLLSPLPHRRTSLPYSPSHPRASCAAGPPGQADSRKCMADAMGENGKLDVGSVQKASPVSAMPFTSSVTLSEATRRWDGSQPRCERQKRGSLPGTGALGCCPGSEDGHTSPPSLQTLLPRGGRAAGSSGQGLPEPLSSVQITAGASCCFSSERPQKMSVEITSHQNKTKSPETLRLPLGCTSTQSAFLEATG